MRRCKKCKQPGHNSATCGKPKKNNVAKGTRACSKCGQTGHNSRTCLGIVKPTSAPSSLAEEGRAILAEQKKKVERTAVNGVKPQKGYWIVNAKRKRIAGQIVYIKRDGTIVWRDFSNLDFTIKSDAGTAQRSGYEYHSTLPEGDDWQYLKAGGWSLND